MRYKITKTLLYGIFNPQMEIEIKTNIKVSKIDIYINNLNFKIEKNKLKIENNYVEIKTLLPRNVRTIKVFMYDGSEKILVINKYYGILYRLLKVLSKPFRIIYDYLNRIIKPLIRGIKIAWQKYHLLIPPKVVIKYFKSYINRIKHPEYNIFYEVENNKEYNKWIKNNVLEEKISILKYNPLISIIIPTYNVNKIMLKECINSVLNQTYQNFEICISDDNSSNIETIECLKEYEYNSKIKINYNKNNLMISKNMNNALKLATGEFIGFLDNDDILDKDALYCVAKVLNEHKELDMIYSDEDKLDENGNYCDVFFKPDYSPDTLLSMNYICHFTVLRKNLLDEVGGFNSKYDGAQDYDLFLRFVEKTNNIYHIPKVLYHWRKSETSTAKKNDNKNYARIAGKNAIEDALKRRNIKGDVILSDNTPFYLVKYSYHSEPKISIVIPTKDHKDVLKKCIDSIYSKTEYKNFEIVLVDNNTTEQESLDYIASLSKYDNIKVIRDKGNFNYSRINNNAIKKCDGEYIVLLNNDTEIISSNWLSIMVGYAMQKHIGTVGVKLLYPDDTIQHAGVILGLGGVASHAYIGKERNFTGYFGRNAVSYNYSANTAACLMVSKKKFEEVNGLDEKLEVAYNDIDFNIKLLTKGYYNVYLPQVELYHYESKSRGYDTEGFKKIRFEHEVQYMKNKWGNKLDRDKFYNDNLSSNFWFMLERRKK